MENGVQGQPAINGAQDPNASLDARIGNIFGETAAEPEPKESPSAPDGEVSETAGDAGEAAPESFEYEYEGEKFILPKKLEKAVMQERDYTQKNMAVAEKERRMEYLQEQARIANFRQAFEAESRDEIQQLNAYDAVLKQPVDWSSMTTDEAFRKKLQLDQWKDEREAVAKSLQAKHQQWEQKTKQALEELNSKGDEVVSKRIPNWNADAWKAIREHAKSDGYTDVELSEIRDPRHKLTLWKAQQFDQLKAKATKTVVDVKSAKTTSSQPMPQHVKDKLAYRKEVAKLATGSKEQQNLVKDRIAKIFG